MTSYTITARNPAAESENRIHADDVARRYGFRGGLVPGVTVYGYVATGLANADPSWISRGGAQVRFRKPCYESEVLEIALGTGGSVEVRSRGEVCVTGQASAAADDPGPAVMSPERAPAPDLRVPASQDVFAPGTSLGWFPLAADKEALAAYLDKIGIDGWAHDAVHPGLLLDAANSVLVANVIMPAWIHVESSIAHHRAVAIGEPVEVHAIVADEWEHKGHRFIRLDVTWRSGADIVAAGRHVAIWRLAGTA